MRLGNPDIAFFFPGIGLSVYANWRYELHLARRDKAARLYCATCNQVFDVVAPHPWSCPSCGSAENVCELGAEKR